MVVALSSASVRTEWNNPLAFQVQVEREVGLLEMMLAENITNCLPTFCVGMKKRVYRHAILATI